ncbi:hypothetical protein M6B38_268105 [Iris pallida]|uniref:Uncharacterized protein n=1 Tax=Iris pallida TaxID=29817 RepID=A0AAX6I9I4_IRIPA|nr:hypothetical protein M6B38_268100 [Iris pallida]KAJ6849661.1 hypothetical protein M6B38_268105 [Iris pallida]
MASLNRQPFAYLEQHITSVMEIWSKPHARSRSITFSSSPSATWSFFILIPLYFPNLHQDCPCFFDH